MLASELAASAAEPRLGKGLHASNAGATTARGRFVGLATRFAERVFGDPAHATAAGSLLELFLGEFLVFLFFGQVNPPFVFFWTQGKADRSDSKSPDPASRLEQQAM